jgi:hypothetical protein
MHRLIFLLLLLSLSIFAQDSLSGDIGGMTFEPSKGPFVIKDNITVQNGKSTVIKAGCVFLFRQFTGIIVNGNLSVGGTPESSVVFTSVSDDKYSKETKDTAKPFDWNGIYIAALAGNVRFSNFNLSYSVFGIKAQKEDIVLKDALFKANGQFHLTIKDKIQAVTDGVPFNYEKPSVKEIPVQTSRTGRSVFGKELPLILGATGLVTGTAAVGSFIIMADANKDYKTEIDPVRQKVLEKKFKANRAAGIVCTGVSLICLPISAILFIKNKKSVSINLSPILGHETGLALAIGF